MGPMVGACAGAGEGARATGSVGMITVGWLPGNETSFTVKSIALVNWPFRRISMA